MTQPPPPASPFGVPLEIPLPGGRTGYYNPYTRQYGTKRSYAQRMQRGYARGYTQAQARRGPGSVATETESQRRRRLAQARGLPAPSQQYSLSADARLRVFGSSYAWYRRMYRLYIGPINSYSSPEARLGISHVLAQLGKGWDEAKIEDRLAFRLAALEAYHEDMDVSVGRQLYIMNLYDPAPPEWWYYH